MKRSLYYFLLCSSLLALTLFSGCSKGPSFEESLAEADAAYAAKDYAAAHVSYIQCLSKNANDIHVLTRLAELGERGSAIKEALYFWRRVRALEEGNLDAAMGIARVARAIGDSEVARLEAIKVLEGDSTNQQAIVIFADASQTPEETQEALDWLLARQSELSSLAGYHRAVGNLRLRQGDTEAALEALHEAETLVTEGAGVFIDLANAYGIQGDIETADGYFQKAIEASDSNLMHRVRWARFQIGTDRREAGSAMLEQMARDEPQYTPAIGYLAQVKFEDGDYERARSLIETALQETPNFLFGELLKNRLLLVDGDTQAAIDGFQDMAERFAKVPQVFYNLALAQLNADQVSPAIGSLSTALRLATSYDEALMLRAELYNRMGSYADAASDMAELLARDPDSTQAALIRAAALNGMGSYDDALVIYRQLEVSASEANRPRMQFLSAGVLRRMENIEEARDQYQAILDADPTFGAAVGRLVELEMSLERYDEGLFYVDRFLEGEGAALPEETKAQYHLLRGLLLRGKGDLEGALAEFKQVIQWAPAMQAAHSELATTYNELGQLDRAIEELNAFLSGVENPGYSALLQLGMFHELNGTYQEAADAYDRLVTQYTDAVVPLNNLAYLYSEFLGDLGKAREYGQRAHAVATSSTAPTDGIDYSLYTGDTLGWIQFRQGEYAQSAALLKVVSQSEAATAEMKYHYGAVTYALGDIAVARQVISEAVASEQEWSTRPQAEAFVEWFEVFDSVDTSLTLMAVWRSPAALQEMALDAAIVDRVNERLTAFPNDANALRMLARHELAAGNPTEASQWIDRALDGNATMALCYVDQAALHFLEGRWDEGGLAAAAARDLEFQKVDLNAALCLAAIEQGDLDYASSLASAVSRDSDWASFGAYTEGVLALLYGDLEASVETLENTGPVGDPLASALVPALKALRAGEAMEPNAAWNPRMAWKVLSAWNLEVGGDDDAALEAYLALLEVSDDLGLVAKRVAYQYLRRGIELSRAERLARGAMDELEEDAEVHTIMGLVSALQSEWSRARTYLERAAALGETNEDWTLALGLAELGEDPASTSARQRLEDALSSTPDHWLADRVRAALAAGAEAP